MTMTKKTWAVILVVVTCAGSGRFAHAILVTGTPTMMPVPPNSGYIDGSPNVSSDNLELYFGSNRPGIFGPWSTWVARRDSPSDAFGVPEAVTSLNHPSISSDGLSLYGTGSGDDGSLDLFVVTRPSTDALWGDPVNLGSSINTAQTENACHISADGLEFYFQRGPYEPNSPEIWVAKRSDTSDPFGDAVKLPPIINEPGNAGSPEISDDGLTLLFASSRPDGLGLTDLWASTRPTKDDAWGEPVNLGPEVNTAFFEETADISPDGRTLYFARTVSTELWENWDLWQVAIISGPAAGDMNGDGAVNGLDVDPFVDVLLNGPYQAEADMNQDGEVDGLDVDPFVAVVVGSGAEQVPEPSTSLLAVLGLLGLLGLGGMDRQGDKQM